MLLVSIIILRLAGVLTLAGVGINEATENKYPLAVHHMFRERYVVKAPKTVGLWSAWSPWTACTRSCGGGVTQQTRHCISRPADSRFVRRQRRRRQANGCVGLYKRIRLCHDQDCPPTSLDFRLEQCAAFNSRTFKGKRHLWQPYPLAPDECALNCRALGADFYATLNKTVIDGTACVRPMTSYGKVAPIGTRGVCIDGSCKSVNSNGVIGSIDVEKQEECSACLQGSCRSVNGLYTRPDLPPGYSLVAQIPQGACRILVQQLKHTRNFLALRNTNGTFILNGDWKTTNNRHFESSNTRFTYVRPDDTSLETISSPGPLANPIDILIVNFQANPGVKYGYSLPITEPSPKRPTEKHLDASNRPLIRRTRVRRRFSWKVSGMTACSKPCGPGGVQAAVLTCIREHSQTQVTDKRCGHLPKPSTQPIRCIAIDCMPKWEAHWTACSASCGDGSQRLVAQCMHELADGRVVQVGDAGCVGERPAAGTRVCNQGACDARDNELPQDAAQGDDWAVGSWSTCSTSCGTGQRTRPISCPSGRCRSDARPKSAEFCDNGPCAPSRWLLTDWSPCSESCGTGTQTRSVLCPETAATTASNCTQTPPETSRACSSDKQCTGEWFSGPWSRCLDACTSIILNNNNNSTNGLGRQQRQVVCIVKIRGQSHLTNDMTCSGGVRPAGEQPCRAECPPRWFMGEWGECDCGGAVQRREVRCAGADGARAAGCAETEMPIGKRQCQCGGREEPKERYKPAHDEPQQPLDRFCTDRIVNCYMAVQARLCQYNYYRNHCCAACRRAVEL